MPGFVKTPADEKKWSKAKSLADKKLKKGSRSFYAYANAIFHRMKGESIIEAKKSNYPESLPQVGMTKKHGPPADHEDRYMTDFKTWFDEIDERKKSSSDKMLTRIPKNKFDTTMEKQKGAKGKPIFPKADKVTVWGAPQDYSYIRA